jgi:hypothetical protein
MGQMLIRDLDDALLREIPDPVRKRIEETGLCSREGPEAAEVDRVGQHGAVIFIAGEDDPLALRVGHVRVLCAFA